jgi:hypothetical protein
MAMGVNPLGLPRPNPCPSVGNVPAKKPMTRHEHNFMPKPMPARVSGARGSPMPVRLSREMGPCAQQDETNYRHNINNTSPHFNNV